MNSILEPIKWEMPVIEPIKFDIPKIEIKIIFLDHDTILIARPVHELIAHLRDFKIPSLVLIARVIKALALAIFRGHFCDKVLLEKENDLLSKTITHHFLEKVFEVGESDFKSAYPYMLENAYRLKPKKDKEKIHDFNYEDVSPDTLRDYFAKCYPRETGNTIDDLFKSSHLNFVK